jgi:hypothetical protein
VFGHGADVFLEDDLLSRCGADHLAEPPEVRRPPLGLARIADIASQEKRFAPKLGGLEIPEGIFTSPLQIPNSCIFDLGDRDGGEVPRAHQASQFDGVATVGLDSIPRLLGDQGGCHDPAGLAFFCQITVESIPTRAGFIDKDEVWTFGLELTDEYINVTLARPDGADGDDLSVMCLGAVCNGKGRFMNVQPNVECARLMHG